MKLDEKKQSHMANDVFYLDTMRSKTYRRQAHADSHTRSQLQSSPIRPPSPNRPKIADRVNAL